MKGKSKETGEMMVLPTLAWWNCQTSWKNRWTIFTVV